MYRFGQPNHDEITILAPLTQCCIIRQSTLRRLIDFNESPQHLSGRMKKSLSEDPVDPVLSEAHFVALDRRVTLILNSVRECLTLKAPEQVITFDEL